VCSVARGARPGCNCAPIAETMRAFVIYSSNLSAEASSALQPPPMFCFALEQGQAQVAAPRSADWKISAAKKVHWLSTNNP
jgi:hypothetical protein